MFEEAFSSLELDDKDSSDDEYSYNYTINRSFKILRNPIRISK